MTTASQSKPEFQEDPPRVAPKKAEADSLLLNIEGFEGPIDVLLELARNQKVDLMQVSILQLVRQYLDFIERAKAMNLDLAAEYLVMAAWLAYLKSRLLLPRENNDPDPSAEEMADALQFQLRRLEAMQQAASDLIERPQLGQQVFGRGRPEGVEIRVSTKWDAKLYDLLKAYGDIKRRKEGQNYDLPTYNLMSTENAMSRLTRMLGQLPKKGLNSVWTTLESFMPEGVTDRLFGRSAMASTFTASLEMAKQGKLEIKQDGLFRPIYMRAVPSDGPDEELEAAE